MTSKSSCNLKIKERSQIKTIAVCILKNIESNEATMDFWHWQKMRACMTPYPSLKQRVNKNLQDNIEESRKLKIEVQCGPMASSERTKWNLLLWIIKYGNGVKTQWLSIYIITQSTFTWTKRRKYTWCFSNILYLIDYSLFLLKWSRTSSTDLDDKFTDNDLIRAYCTLVKVL